MRIRNQLNDESTLHLFFTCNKTQHWMLFSRRQHHWVEQREGRVSDELTSQTHCTSQTEKHKESSNARQIRRVSVVNCQQGQFSPSKILFFSSSFLRQCVRGGSRIWSERGGALPPPPPTETLRFSCSADLLFPLLLRRLLLRLQPLFLAQTGVEFVGEEG